MKKTIVLLACVALSGCVNSAYQQETDNVLSSDEPIVVQNESRVVKKNVGTMMPVPTQESPVITQQALPMQQSMMPLMDQVPANAMVFEIPAQPLYITDTGVMAPQPIGQSPLPTQPVEQPGMQPQVSLITLQTGTNPIQYTQCLSTDVVCLNNAYAQGFMPVQYAPQFAGYQDVLGPTDYPAGSRWWNSNNIPRW